MNTDLRALLAGLTPLLNQGTFVYACVPHDADISALAPVATIREAEGLSVIVEESRAAAARLPVRFRAAWITLAVESELQAVGLTAAVSKRWPAPASAATWSPALITITCSYPPPMPTQPWPPSSRCSAAPRSDRMGRTAAASVPNKDAVFAAARADDPNELDVAIADLLPPTVDAILDDLVRQRS